MAELLVCAKDSNGVGNGQYKKGDIVAVMEDGHQWGTKETLPKFFVLKISDTTAQQILDYLEPEYVGGDPENGMLKRRLWGFLINNVPQGVRDTIVATGEYTTTVAAIKQYVRNKVNDDEATF